MIYIATATVTPSLEGCLRDALARTTDAKTYRWLVLRGPASHGVKLDEAWQRVPSDAEWFGTLHDDTAPLRPGWLPWLLEQITARGLVCGGIDTAATGGPASSCTFWRARWLRQRPPGVGFAPYRGVDGRWRDVACGIHEGVPSYIAPSLKPPDLPEWLATHEEGVVADAVGALTVAHLGGGTIGATNRQRISAEEWVERVDKHLAGLPYDPPREEVIVV